MEVAEVYVPGGSLRRGGESFIWRTNATDGFFSISSRFDDSDDEDSLKWAAIQRLPTYDRLKKGLFGSSEIDVSKLGFQERRTLLDRLIKIAEEDNERFLLQLKSRIQR